MSTTVSVKLSKNAIPLVRGLLAAVSKDEGRPILEGIWKVGAGSTARVFATDGRRIHWLPITCDTMYLHGAMNPGQLYRATWIAKEKTVLLETMDGTPHSMEAYAPEAIRKPGRDKNGQTNWMKQDCGKIKKQTVWDNFSGMLALATGRTFQTRFMSAIPEGEYEVIADKDTRGPVWLVSDSFGAVIMPCNDEKGLKTWKAE
jgi:hypothetical protein